MKKIYPKEILIFNNEESIEAVKKHLKDFPFDIPQPVQIANPNYIYSRNIPGFIENQNLDRFKRDLLMFWMGYLCSSILSILTYHFLI